MKSNIINFPLSIIVLLSMLTYSCRSDEATIPLVVANFETDLTIEQYQAKLTLTNTSEQAETYQWTFSGGTPESSTEENPSVMFYKNGTHTVTLTVSDGEFTDTKSIDVVVENIDENAPYRYLENESILMYYETEDVEVYRTLIPEEFEEPSRYLVYTFIIDFYKLDYGLTPYKENSMFILVEHQGNEYWHCVYMPVTDEHSMWAGIAGLGLPKTLGDISLTRANPLYYGRGENPLGAVMNLSVNTENYTINESAKQEMISLSKLPSLQIRRGEIISMGRTNESGKSIIESADRYPDLLTLKFGEGTVSTNTETTAAPHPLDLTPSRVIGAYYLKNTIPFGLTGSPL